MAPIQCLSVDKELFHCNGCSAAEPTDSALEVLESGTESMEGEIQIVSQMPAVRISTSQESCEGDIIHVQSCSSLEKDVIEINNRSLSLGRYVDKSYGCHHKGQSILESVVYCVSTFFKDFFFNR